MHLNKAIRNDKGSTMIVVLLVMVVLMILGVVIMNTSVAENKFAKKNEDRIQAYYIARSGAQTVAEYIINGEGEDLIGKTSDPNTQIGGGTFTVTVAEDTSNDLINITSVGEYNGTTQTAKIGISTTGGGPGGIFQYAIAAVNSVTLAGGNGNGTNVEGDLVYKNASGSISLDKASYNNKVSNDPPTHDPNLIFPEIVPPTTYNETYPTITSSRTINSSINAPKFVSVGTIDLGGSSNLNITGDGIVHMYVTGTISSGGNSSITVSPQAELYVYVIGNGTVHFSGSSTAGAIFLYAPNSLVKFTNAQLSYSGAIIGQNVQLQNNQTIIFDSTMFNNVNLDKTYLGTEYTGYSWFD